MSYSLPTLYMLIDILHHLARIETVVLSEIDEKAAITSLSLARTASAALSSTATLTFATTFTSTAALSFATALAGRISR